MDDMGFYVGCSVYEWEYYEDIFEGGRDEEEDEQQECESVYEGSEYAKA